MSKDQSKKTTLIPTGESLGIGEGMQEVAPLSIDNVFTDKSVYNALPAMYIEQANQIGAAIDVTPDGADVKAMRELGQESQAVLNKLGSMLIDDKRVNETAYVGELLRDIETAKDQIPLDVIKKDPDSVRRFFMSLPLIGSWFNPVFRFKEGWEKVDSKIDGWYEKIDEYLVQMIGLREMLRTAQTENRTAFRALDIAVAGGEVGIAREFEEFKAAVLDNRETRDVVTLLELQSRRSALENTALLMTRYQNARGRSQANFPILAAMQRRVDTVITDLETLKETVIPQLRLIVGASIQNLETRRTMADNRQLTELLTEGEQQLLAALNLAEDEEHALKMEVASAGEKIAALFQGLTDLSKKAAENRQKELTAFAESKKTLLTAIEDWKTETKDILVDSVEGGITKSDDGSSEKSDS